MSKTVTMVFATKANFFDAAQVMHSFGPGVCEVPEEFADHPYIKAHGAQRYRGAQTSAADQAAADQAAADQKKKK